MEEGSPENPRRGRNEGAKKRKNRTTKRRGEGKKKKKISPLKPLYSGLEGNKVRVWYPIFLCIVFVGLHIFLEVISGVG